eukprot:Em0007g1522a
MFGREVKLPIDYRSNPIEQTTLPEYVQKLKDGLEKAYFLVREQCESEHKKQKSIYDEKVHDKPFNCGDLVCLTSCTARLKPAVATSNPVREDLVAVPTPTSTKTANPETAPLEWADEILCLESDDEEAEELDHIGRNDGRCPCMHGPEPAAVFSTTLLHAKQETAMGPTCSIDGREWCNEIVLHSTAASDVGHGCPPGVPLFECFVDPCLSATCPAHPHAVCVADFCGGCNAKFFDHNGKEVTSSCNLKPY